MQVSDRQSVNFSTPFGMIAGNGVYPLSFAKAAREAGVCSLAAVCFEGETEKDLLSLVDSWEWLRVGQLGKMINFFQHHGVAQAVMVGQIAPKNLFDFRPDLKALMVIGKLRKKNAETIFGGIAEELAKGGVELVSAVTFLEDDLAPSGHFGGPAPGKDMMRDATFGFEIAKEVSRLDIGQTVVVRAGTVLAVEAFEGTNEAIRRGGSMGKGKAIMVKVSKPKQDFRFDVPVIGPATIETAAQCGIRGIVVESGCTLILEKEKTKSLAVAHRLSLFGMDLA